MSIVSRRKVAHEMACVRIICSLRRANSGKWPANVEGERQVYTPHFRIVSRLDPLQHLPETEGGCLRQHLGWGLLTSNTFDRVEL